MCNNQFSFILTHFNSPWTAHLLIECQSFNSAKQVLKTFQQKIKTLNKSHQSYSWNRSLILTGHSVGSNKQQMRQQDQKLTWRRETVTSRSSPTDPTSTSMPQSQPPAEPQSPVNKSQVNKGWVKKTTKPWCFEFKGNIFTIFWIWSMPCGTYRITLRWIYFEHLPKLKWHLTVFTFALYLLAK